VNLVYLFFPTKITNRFYINYSHFIGHFFVINLWIRTPCLQLTHQCFHCGNDTFFFFFRLLFMKLKVC